MKKRIFVLVMLSSTLLLLSFTVFYDNFDFIRISQ